MSEYTSSDCTDARWWDGYATGCQDTARMAERIEDPAELADLVDRVTEDVDGPVWHTFRGRPMKVVRTRAVTE